MMGYRIPHTSQSGEKVHIMSPDFLITARNSDSASTKGECGAVGSYDASDSGEVNKEVAMLSQGETDGGDGVAIGDVSGAWADNAEGFSMRCLGNGGSTSSSSSRRKDGMMNEEGVVSDRDSPQRPNTPPTPSTPNFTI